MRGRYRGPIKGHVTQLFYYVIIVGRGGTRNLASTWVSNRGSWKGMFLLYNFATFGYYHIGVPWVGKFGYRIYSINRPGRLLNFWTLRVGAYSRWALIRGWALLKFSQFQKL